MTVVPNAAYTGPINLLVGVRDQINRAGTGQPIDSPTNFSTENIVINVVQPVGTGTVRFILDSPTSATGNLVITPLPRPSPKANNTILDVTQQDGNIEVIVNGAIDLNQPAMNNVDSIVVYGSKANDRITIDPSITVPVTLSGGTGGHNVLIAAGGPTRQQGWYGTNVEKQEQLPTITCSVRRATSPSSRAPGPATSSSPGPSTTPEDTRGSVASRSPLRTSFFSFSGTKLVKRP